jgi:hypothetical protein
LIHLTAQVISPPPASARLNARILLQLATIDRSRVFAELEFPDKGVLHTVWPNVFVYANTTIFLGLMELERPPDGASDVVIEGKYYLKRVDMAEAMVKFNRTINVG